LPERLRSDGLDRRQHILRTMAHFRYENVPVRLGAAAYRDVVDGDQNQVRPARALQLARIDQGRASPSRLTELADQCLPVCSMIGFAPLVSYLPFLISILVIRKPV